MLTYLAKIACLLGLHGYRDWTYAAPTTCEQLPVCEWCGHFRATKSRVVHVWGNPVYSVEGVCEKIQICIRCRATKSAFPAVVHVLSEPAYTSSDSCVMARICHRCRWIDIESAAMRHVFGEWINLGDICHQFRICLRCGFQDKQEHHNWLPTAYGSSCSQCHTTQPTRPGLCYQCGHRAIPGENVYYACV